MNSLKIKRIFRINAIVIKSSNTYFSGFLNFISLSTRMLNQVKSYHNCKLGLLHSLKLFRSRWQLDSFWKLVYSNFIPPESKFQFRIYHSWMQSWLDAYSESNLHSCLHVLDEADLSRTVSIHCHHHLEHRPGAHHQELRQDIPKNSRESSKRRKYDKNPHHHCSPLHCLSKYQTCSWFLWGIHLLQP